MAARKKVAPRDAAGAPATPGQQAARKWQREIDLAGRREKDWRDEGEKIIKRYRGEERRKSRFNVLWSNTEILRGSVYNSRPNPDVRRRFRDSDPVGKAVSEILERCLSVLVDGSEFDGAMRNDTLDSLLPGRGLSRVRYVASIAATGGEAAQEAEADANRQMADTDRGEGEGSTTGVADAPATDPADTNEAEEGGREELQFERVVIEHVDWRDFRQGYGRTWEEVPWVAFRCKLTSVEAKGMFEEALLADVKFTAQQSDDPNKPGAEQGETQNLAEFWEVWDKEGKRVFFLQESCEALLYPKANPDGKPPLDLVDFFPIPEPMRIVENTSSLLPIPIFTLYKEQADELDRISLRITKITDGLRLRGVYDSSLPEMADLLDSNDNQLTPIQNGKQWRDVGLEKAITWMPVKPAADVLQQLYVARDAAKRIIDEITGISDIIRGATMASETATAQQIKANYASVRLQRMQKEVQRYCRDLLRLAAEVMANKFGQDTFAQMTELKLPTEAEKQAMVVQQQRAAQQAQAMGQPPPPVDPALQKIPTWEQVMAVMRDDAIRHFKVDVETDSTVAGTLESDMQGLSQVLGAITQALSGMAPLVMQGALPVEAAKEVVLSVTRRARMGLAVEDAFDKLQAPKPPAQPPTPPDTAPQVAQIRAQTDQQLEQMRQQGESQRRAMELQAQQQREEADRQHQTHLQEMKDASARAIADARNQTDLEISERDRQHAMALESQRQQAQAAEAERVRLAAAPPPVVPGTDAPTAGEFLPEEGAAMAELREILERLARPTRVVRGQDGMIVGFQQE